MAGVMGATPEDQAQQAQYLMKEGQFDEGLRILEGVIERYPSCEFALRSLGYAYGELGRHVDAMRMMERAAEQEPLGETVRNALYFRSQISYRIMDGEPPNGDGPPLTL